MEPTIQAFFDKATFTVTYLVSDPATGEAAVIDPVLNFDPKSGRTSTHAADAVLKAAKEQNLAIRWILETHAHADHLSASMHLKEKTGAMVAIGQHIARVQKVFQPIFNASDVTGDGKPFDRLFKDGEHFAIGELDVEVLHTPGHTPACVSYKVGSNVFVGDTLFMPDYGTARADFPGGDARMLYRSIRRLLSLPDETTLWMCHDYKAPGRDTFSWKTTVAEERAANVHVHDGVDEDTFVAMREARDRTLEMPVLILPSVQVNIRAGHMPPPENDGNVYLKIPVNRL
ncbi:MAG TPA: MBL fold metallo-hydrolase [Rhizomicrobium sp.]|nr:MBL fold metallo-hydrolase [Rhizomicrobium sp.]